VNPEVVSVVSGSYWDDLLSTALVGTERRPLPAAGVPAVLAGPAGAAASADPAVALLDTAALVTVYRRAGMTAGRGVPVPAAAPDEELPVAPVAAADRLAGLLGADPTGLVAEWLGLAAERGVLAPPELLPALLDLGRRQTELRASLVRVGGRRVRWLAAQHPDWAYLTRIAGGAAGPDPAAWEFGDVGSRLDHLRAVRAGDPAAGRELLAGGWATEGPAERAALLDALAVGLSAADEEFLEAALDDRRKEVREAAAELLAGLPGSGYAARMAERALACVRPSPDGRAIDVTSPAAVDAALRRDGLTPVPTPTPADRLGWLERIVARAPLSTWAPLAPSPLHFLRRPVHGGGQQLRAGLAAAAATQHDTGWALALLATTNARDSHPMTAALLGVLPADRRNTYLVGELAGRSKPDPQLLGLLESCPPPWSVELGRAALRAVRRSRKGLGWRIHSLCGLIARRLPVELADEAQEFSARFTDDESGGRAVAELGPMVAFRKRMQEEFA
jgi:hypothetical protein